MAEHQAKKRRHRTPSVRWYAKSNQFRITIAGRDYYLGSDRRIAEGKAHALLADHLLAETAGTPPPSEITVGELAEQHDAYLKKYFETNPKQYDCVRSVLRRFLDLYGFELTKDITPKRLSVFRNLLLKDQRTVSTINRYVRYVIRLFRWGASEGLSPVETWTALSSLESLKAGRCGARISAPVLPVAWEDVEATLPFLPRPVAGIVRLMWVTGARVGEIVGLKFCDIDTSGAVWEIKLADHKTAHRGHVRTLVFGPEGQGIIREFAARRGPYAMLFSPLDSVAERSERADGHRRPNQKPNPAKTDRTIGDRYNSRSVGKAIERGIIAANIDRREKGLPLIQRWHSHQIRHTFATRVRARAGVEAARIALGHRDAGITLTYAEADLSVARDIAAEIG